MNGVDSVETLVITKATDSNTAAVEDTVTQRRGGLLRRRRPVRLREATSRATRVETAVESVYARGGGVGGTSAGMAIQGEFTYDGCTGSATSAEALANPYHRRVTFTYDFFHWANMQGTITDSHFVPRDRMGRTMAFLARQIKDGQAASALGVAVNEVDLGGGGPQRPRDRRWATAPPTSCSPTTRPRSARPGTPLTYSNFKIWKVPAGGTFDLRNRPTTGYYLRSVTNGVLSAEPLLRYRIGLGKSCLLLKGAKQT